jgi:hypothetical protein
MLRGLPQQVAHVKVIEVDARDAPFFAHKPRIEAEAKADDNPNPPLPRSSLRRRSIDPVVYDDATMLKLAIDATGRQLVYQRAQDWGSAKAPVYLKYGENRYIEFGARKFYPPYVPASP